MLDRMPRKRARVPRQLRFVIAEHTLRDEANMRHLRVHQMGHRIQLGRRVRIAHLWIVVNPDKLHALTPTS